MAKATFSKKFNHQDRTVEVNLGMYIFKEEDAVIVYCPALDLSSYGDTEDQAKKAFESIFESTFKYMLNKKTLKEDLINHGWEIKSLKQKKLKAPSIDTLLDKNESFRDILSNKEYSKYEQRVGIPEFF